MSKTRDAIDRADGERLARLQLAMSPSGADTRPAEPTLTPSDAPAPPGFRSYRRGAQEIVWLPDDRPKPAPEPAPTMGLADVPDGAPATIAVQLLGKLRPRWADEIRSNLDHVARQIADVVSTPYKLRETVDRLAPLVKRAFTLAGRLAVLESREAPATDAAAEVAAMVPEIERFRDSAAMRAELDGRIAGARDGLARVEGSLEFLIRSAGNHQSPEDWLRLVSDGLRRRAEIAARLDRLSRVEPSAVVGEMAAEAFAAIESGS